MRSNNTKPPLPFEDYCRISQVICSAALAAGEEPQQACRLYSLAGAAILKRYYDLDAVSVSGAAAYALGSRGDVIISTFGRMEDDTLIATPRQFHCWIECDGFVIDLMAPIFRENLRAYGTEAIIPRRAFQKPLTAMSPTLSRELQERAFYLVPCPKLTEDLREILRRKPLLQDFINLCFHWFRRPPAEINKFIGMVDERGRRSLHTLLPIEIDGSW